MLEDEVCASGSRPPRPEIRCTSRRCSRWCASTEASGEIVVPPTIHALLQARIDSLDGDVRVVMERGSVEGEVFHRGAVAELSPDPVRRGGRVASDDARAQGAHPLDVVDVPRGRGFSLPPPPHPRRRLRVAPEGDASRAPRALRRLALRPRARRRGRDRRVSPRAGASVPRRARTRRPRRSQSSRRELRSTSRCRDEAHSIAATSMQGVGCYDERPPSYPRETRRVSPLLPSCLRRCASPETTPSRSPS